MALFEGLREVPSILLLLTLQGMNCRHERDAGGGSYKPLMDLIGAVFVNSQSSGCKGRKAEPARRCRVP